MKKALMGGGHRGQLLKLVSLSYNKIFGLDSAPDEKNPGHASVDVKS